jgi:hypothetical protein
LRSWQFFSESRNPPYLKIPEGLLGCLLEPASYPYPEPDPSTPPHASLSYFSKIQFNIFAKYVCKITCSSLHSSSYHPNFCVQDRATTEINYTLQNIQHCRMSSHTQHGCPLYQVQCRAQIDMFYTMLYVGFFLYCCHLVATFEIRRLGIF